MDDIQIIVLVTSYCGVVGVAFKATELNKTCLTALLLLFFCKHLIGRNPLRASRTMMDNGCSFSAIKYYTCNCVINSITYCLFLLETCLN